MSRSTLERGPIRRALGLAGAAAILIGVSAAIVYPIWLLATTRPSIFSALVFLSVTALVIAIVARRLMARLRRGLWSRKRGSGN